MPYRAWRSRRHPPGVSDHIAAHLYEIAIAFFGGLIGVTIIFAAWSPPFHLSPLVDSLNPVIDSFVGVLLSIGGFLIVLGLLDDDDDLIKGWMYERMGLVLSGVGWIGWGIAVSYYRPINTLLWVLFILMGLLHLARVIVTYLDEYATKKAIAKSKLLKNKLLKKD